MATQDTLVDVFRLTRVDPVTGLAEAIPAKERVDALLSRPEAPALIRQLDHQALFSLISEAGVNDAYDLVLYASGEQVQSIVDFDCWTRDIFQVERFTNWLEVLLQRDDAGFREMVDEMDPEAIVFWLRSHVQVFLWEEDRELLDTLEGPLVTSPDGVYALIVPDEDQVGVPVRHLLQRLYAEDILMGHRYLEAVRWELSSDLEERAYRLRDGRLGDLGFVPFHEAVEVYAWLPPRPWAAAATAKAMTPDTEPIILGDAGRLPPVDHQLQLLEERRFSERTSVFAQALGGIGSHVEEAKVLSVAESVLSQFRAVANRAHLADGGNPGDMQAARNASARAERYLSLGLELAAGDDRALASRILMTAPLRDIHRAGYSATLELQRQATRLVERGALTLTDAPLSLLDSNESDPLLGLLRRRPSRSETYDTPISTMAEVRALARGISEVAFVELTIFGTLRMRHDELSALIYDSERNATPVEMVTYRTLLSTRLLHLLRGEAGEILPMTLSELHASCDALASSEPDTLVEQLAESIRPREGASQGFEALSIALAARVVGRLLDELGSAQRPIAREVAQSLVLLTP